MLPPKIGNGEGEVFRLVPTEPVLGVLSAQLGGSGVASEEGVEVNGALEVDVAAAATALEATRDEIFRAAQLRRAYQPEVVDRPLDAVSRFEAELARQLLLGLSLPQLQHHWLGRLWLQVPALVKGRLDPLSAS